MPSLQPNTYNRPNPSQIGFRASRSNPSADLDIRKLNKRIQELEWQNTVLEERTQSLKSDLDATKIVLKDTQIKLRDSESKSLELSLELDDANTIITELKTNLCRVQNEYNHLTNSEWKFNKEGRAEAIREIVCEYYNVPIDALKLKGKGNIGIEPKQMVAFMIDLYTFISANAISNYIFLADHTSTIYSINQIKERAKKHESVMNAIERIGEIIKEKLGSSKD